MRYSRYSSTLSLQLMTPSLSALHVTLSPSSVFSQRSLCCAAVQWRVKLLGWFCPLCTARSDWLLDREIIVKNGSHGKELGLMQGE
jgi:hypothetical protein